MWYKLRKLVLGSLVIHIFLLLVVFDLHFTSPLQHGMTPHKSEEAPFSSRVVLFVIDGLRAETLYNDHQNITPYLTSQRNQSAWGTVNTHVPTETRPGHIALLGGIHEDPSAILTGWQNNLVRFDTVLNQSKHAYSFGSPDVVNIFTKHDPINMTVSAYSTAYQDFSGKTSTIRLDDWVLEQVKKQLTFVSQHCILRKGYERSFLSLRTSGLVGANDHEYASCILNCGGDCIPAHKCSCSYMQKEYFNKFHFLSKNEDFNECNVYYDPRCQSISSDGNVFFIHLLGMDSAGHIHKPNSKKYLDNLVAVDGIIKETVRDFKKLFSVEDTTFIVTSDHGMTDWGSHGDGTDHETQVPFIAWGKGIKKIYIKDMNQIDIAPLMASLIGVPIPVNSMGVLRHELLDGTKEQILHAVYTNVKQLAEQYEHMERNLNKDPLFVPYPGFRDPFKNLPTVLRGIKESIDHRSYEETIKISEEVTTKILDGLKYMKDYYSRIKIYLVMTGMVVWIISMALSIPTSMFIMEGDDIITDAIKKSCKTIKNYILLVTPVAFSYLIFIGASMMAYAYYLFPVIVYLGTMNDEKIYRRVTRLLREGDSNNFYCSVLIMCLLQLMALGFKTKSVYVNVLMILPIWFFLLEKQHVENAVVQMSWLISCSVLGIFLMVDMPTTFTYAGLLVGLFCWLAYYIVILINETKYGTRSVLGSFLALLPLVLIINAGIIIYEVAHSFDNHLDLGYTPQATAWVITVIAMIHILIHKPRLVSKFNFTAACLLIPYSLMSVGFDILIYTVLIALLYCWIQLEYSLMNTFMSIHAVSYDDDVARQRPVKLSDYRRAFYYVSLLLCYFFAIGNLASLNGFDPMWTRTYVSTFSRTLMAALIIFKIIIPFFAITCAYFVVNNITSSDDVTCFKTIILYLDQMVLTFMLNVKHEGSWKEIGQSLSHFIIMDVMALVVILFYYVVRFIIR